MSSFIEFLKVNQDSDIIIEGLLKNKRGKQDRAE
jgi:hypothetical protein